MSECECVKTRKSRYLNLKPVVTQKIRGSLLVVDNEPIRNQSLKGYDEARAIFQEVQAEIGNFHRLDKPQFDRWVRDQFGDLIREVASTKGKVGKLHELIFEVETRTWLKNQSFAAAYRDVIERRAKNNGKSSDEDLEDLKHRMNEKMGADPSQGESAQQPSTDIAAKLGVEKMARLKTAYRSMARRFHPDCNTDLTPEMQEIWFEAQRAYLAGDVELLESIDAAAHEGEGVTHLDSPVSLIQRRTEQLLQNHRVLLKKMDDLQRDPAWGFSGLSSTTKLKKRLAKELPEELKSLNEELKRLQVKINSWKEDAERYYPGFKEAHGDKKTPVKPGKIKVEPTPPPQKTATRPPRNTFNRRRAVG